MSDEDSERAENLSGMVAVHLSLVTMAMQAGQPHQARASLQNAAWGIRELRKMIGALFVELGEVDHG